MCDSPPFCIKSVAVQMKKLSSTTSLDELASNENQKTSDPEDVELLTFVDVYDELCKFIGMLGKIFEFVEKDVRVKIELLRELHTSDPEGYKSILNMVKMEKENPIIHKGKESGVVAVLHLNRALEFIVEFMKAAVASTNDDSIPKICKESYDGTLAKHHPWIVRTAVKVAVYTLPTREKMLEYLKGTHPDEASIRCHVEDVVSHGKVVHSRINTIYTLHELMKIA